ncbi:hypothetical protein J2X38_002606 [Sphingopyxis sp. BE235]|nr:hypothetical protein [Sphingopyxis sp. BE235]MDR7179932.1 hypothetical protein [Sphingopyxis sp. BE249]
MRERSGTPDRALRGNRIFVDLGDAPLSDANLHHFERPRNAGQQIIEVMRDAARELADSFHLLRLPERLFGTVTLRRGFFHFFNQPRALLLKPALYRFASRYIKHCAHHPDRRAIFTANDIASVENVGEAAVRTAKAIFVGPVARASVDHMMDARIDPRAVFSVDLPKPPFAGGHDVVGTVAVSAFESGVPRHMIGPKIPVPDRIVRRASRETKALLDLAQLCAGLAVARDVLHGADEPNRLSAVEKGEALGTNVTKNPVFDADRAILDIEPVTSIGIERRGDGAVCALAIIGVKAGEKCAFVADRNSR